MLLDELERERRERLQAQERVKQLMGEHPHLELERKLQRLTEELELERKGRTHNQRERQRLGEELERERLARSGDQRNFQRLERDLQDLQRLLDEQQQALKVPKKSLWTNHLKAITTRIPTEAHSEPDEHRSVCEARAAHLHATPRTA
jgi:hypothetical protein